MKVDKTQTVLGFKPKQEGESSGGLMLIVFSVEACREALAEMLIIDELPYGFVEDEGFRGSCLLLSLDQLEILLAQQLQKIVLECI